MDEKQSIDECFSSRRSDRSAHIHKALVSPSTHGHPCRLRMMPAVLSPKQWPGARQGAEEDSEGHRAPPSRILVRGAGPMRASQRLGSCTQVGAGEGAVGAAGLGVRMGGLRSP